MESYLQQTTDKLPSLASGDGCVHVVVGSEACDLDSAASALGWAYYLSTTGALKDVAVVPVLAVVRQDFGRRAVPRAHLGGECGLDERLFPFLDDVDLASLASAGRLSLTLVDHNGVANWHGSDDPAACTGLVRQVIDHHQRQSDVAFAPGCDVVIEPVGSCSTLVAERLLSDERTSSDVTALRMLYGAIIYDTVCLSPVDGRMTPKDEKVALAIENALGCGETERRRIYDTLCRARADFLGAVTTVDLLLADKKIIVGPTTRIVVPSVTVHAKALLERTDFASDLGHVADKECCDAVVVMTLGSPDSTGTSDEAADKERHIIVFSHHLALRLWIANALLASELKPTEAASDAPPADLPELRVLKQVDHRQSRKLVLPLLQTIISAFNSPDANATGGSSFDPPALSSLLESGPASTDPLASTWDASAIALPVVYVDGSAHLSPTVESGRNSNSNSNESNGDVLSDRPSADGDASAGAAQASADVLSARLSADVGASASAAQASTFAYDPFDPFDPFSPVVSAPSTWQPVAAVSGSADQTISATSAPVFSHDVFGALLPAGNNGPVEQPALRTLETALDPFGLDILAGGDVSVTASPAAAERYETAAMKTSVPDLDDGIGHGGAAVPRTSTTSHNPFSVDPFGGDPFGLELSSSSTVDVGLPTVIKTAFGDSLLPDSNPFGTSSFVGNSFSAFATGPSLNAAAGDAGANRNAVAGDAGANQNAAAGDAGANPFAGETALASSGYWGEPIADAAEHGAAEFAEKMTVLVVASTSSSPVQQPSGGREWRGADGSLPAFSESDNPTFAIADLPSTGTGRHDRAVEDNVSPSSAATSHTDALLPHRSPDSERAPAITAAPMLSVQDVHQSAALDLPVGSDDHTADAAGTAAALASSRDPSLPPADLIGAAAAYDDEAFSSVASGGSSSPTADGSASSSSYSFLPASAELFRLAFVQQYDMRGSSVSSLDSAVAARGSSVSSLDSSVAVSTGMPYDAHALDANAEMPSDLSCLTSDVGSPAIAGDLLPEVTDEARTSEMAEGKSVIVVAASPAAADEKPALEASSAVLLPSSVTVAVAAVDSATASTTLLAEQRHRLQQQQQIGAPARAVLLRPSESDGGSRSSSMPGTPNNSYYDSSMFERFAAVQLDGHKVVSRILQHQDRREGAPMATWSIDESAADAPAVWTSDAAGPVLPLSLSLSPTPDASDFRSTNRGDVPPIAAYVGTSSRSGSLLAAGRSDAAMPLTPANSYADSFRSPDGGWPPGGRVSAREDVLLQLSSNEMLQKMLLKKAALHRPDADDSFASRDGTPGTESPGTDLTQSAGCGSSRRRSVDSGSREEEEEEGVFQFEHDDDAEGRRRHADGTLSADRLPALASVPIVSVGAGADALASSASPAAPVAVQAERKVEADVIAGEEGAAESSAAIARRVDVTADASTFVNYLASVDPLRGRLDLVTDADELVRTQASVSTGAAVLGDDGLQRGGHVAVRSSIAGASVAKRHSIAGRWEAESAQIVEGVDIGVLAGSDATAAALFRRASLDSSVVARQLQAMAAAAAGAAVAPPATAGAVVGSSNAKPAECSSTATVNARAASGTDADAPVANASDFTELRTNDCTTAAEAEQTHTELAERIVARALNCALAVLSGGGEELASSSAAAVASSACGDDSAVANDAAYVSAAQNLVGRVLAEAKARLVLAGSEGRPVDDDKDDPADDAEGGRRYSGWMIDSVLGADADTSKTVADASSGHLTEVAEESVVPSSAGVVSSAAGEGRRANGFSLPLRPSRGDGNAGATASEVGSDYEASASPVGLSSPSDSLRAMLSTVADLETPEDGGTSCELDASILQDLENISSDSALSLSDKASQQQQPMEIVPLDAAAEDGPAEWCDVMVGGREHHVDMRAIKPYCKLLSHGGLYNSDGSILIVFSACYFPSAKSVKNYSYVMDNLLLYVLSGIELMVPEGKDYSVLYFHGAADKSQLPSMAFLKRCRDEGHVRLRKSLKGMYLVHPTMWLRSVVLCSKAIVSSKFSRKIVYVQSLEVLRKVLSLEYVTVPPQVVEFDRQKFAAKK